MLLGAIIDKLNQLPISPIKVPVHITNKTLVIWISLSLINFLFLNIPQVSLNNSETIADKNA